MENEVVANGKFNAARSSSVGPLLMGPHMTMQNVDSRKRHHGITAFRTVRIRPALYQCLPPLFFSDVSDVEKLFNITGNNSNLYYPPYYLLKCLPTTVLIPSSSVWIFSQEPQSYSLAWVSMVIEMTFKMHMPPVTFRFLGFTKVPAEISFPPLYWCLFWMGRHGLFLFFSILLSVRAAYIILEMCY